MPCQRLIPVTAAEPAERKSPGDVSVRWPVEHLVCRHCVLGGGQGGKEGYKVVYG